MAPMSSITIRHVQNSILGTSSPNTIVLSTKSSIPNQRRKFAGVKVKYGTRLSDSRLSEKRR